MLILEAFKGASFKIKALVMLGVITVIGALGAIGYGTLTYFEEQRSSTLYLGLEAIAERNYPRASLLLSQASSSGSLTAAEFSAWLECCRGNYEKSYTAASEAAAKGSREVLEVMGDLALLGYGKVTGATAAVSYFNQKAESESSSYEGRNLLVADCIGRALPLAREHQDYLDLVLAGLDHNSPDCYLHLGDILFLGDGLTVNAVEAVSMWQLALEHQIKEAATRLAGAYWHGYAVEPDRAKALELYKQAAAWGDPVAYYALGLIGLREDGARDPLSQARENAVTLLRQASILGYKPADVILGFLALHDDPHGAGIDRALNWFSAAFKGNDSSGAVMFALMKAAGLGTAVDKDGALVMLYDEGMLGSETAAQVLQALSLGEDPRLIVQQATELAWRIIFGDIEISQGAAEARAYHDGQEHGVKYYKGKAAQLIDPKIYQIDGKYLIVPSIGGIVVQSQPSTGARLYEFTGQKPTPEPPPLPEGYKGRPVMYQD